MKYSICRKFFTLHIVLISRSYHIGFFFVFFRSDRTILVQWIRSSYYFFITQIQTRSHFMSVYLGYALKGTRPTLKLCIFRVISFFYRYFSDNLLKVIFTNLLLFSLENDIRENNKTKLPQTAVSGSNDLIFKREILYCLVATYFVCFCRNSCYCVIIWDNMT